MQNGKRVVISMEANETVLDNGGPLAKIMLVQPCTTIGKATTGRSYSCWEDGCASLKSRSGRKCVRADIFRWDGRRRKARSWEKRG